jgi:folate-binding protein YgfZ
MRKETNAVAYDNRHAFRYCLGMTTVIDSPAVAREPLGAFSAGAAAFDALAAGAALAPLTELGRIRVDGADAASFLQSQLTNDVAHRPADALALNGYCTPKGRLLATFHQWRDGDAVMLELPREILAPVMKRLTMFVLRAKAKLADVSDGTAAWGLVGTQAATRLSQAGLPVPAAAWASAATDGVRVSRLPAAGGVERFLLHADASVDLAARLSLPAVDSGAWWWSEVATAVPTVFAATQEKFVPQMINFEVLGGVDFKKGCYPGQEIVARSQYLGKLKRRMRPGHVAPGAPPAAGTDVLDAEGVAIGTVVMAATAPGGGVDLLLEAPVDRLDGGAVRTAAGTPIALRPLPYELFDPTA